MIYKVFSCFSGFLPKETRGGIANANNNNNLHQNSVGKLNDVGFLKVYHIKKKTGKVCKKQQTSLSYQRLICK